MLITKKECSFFTSKSQVWCHISWESFARNLEPYHFSGYRENFDHDPRRLEKIQILT